MDKTVFEKVIRENFGERCPDYEPTCMCCQAWHVFDALFDNVKIDPYHNNVWLRVVDEAMVSRHIGIADAFDDYDTAKRKLQELLDWEFSLGQYIAQEETTPPLSDDWDDIFRRIEG